MKVTYTMLNGRESTAYLNDEPIAEDTYEGTNKHSDEDVKVTWDSDDEKWVEIEGALGAGDEVQG